ncbi:MAG: ribosome recycling factor [Ruminococcus sp.]|nr:ribosome recycling factor [Ruminococcus sp.]
MQEQLTKTSQRMQRRIDHLVDEYSQIRAGRANPALLEKIKIDYYGTPRPISQVASISVAEARTLTIQPWDASVIRDIERAIQTSDLGINPQNDGKILRIIFPPLTEDRRKEIVKDISKLAEETKVQIRNVRRECMEKLKAMKKDGELTEDDLKQAEKKTQDLTDKFVKKTDELSSAKQKEIMEI